MEVNEIEIKEEAKQILTKKGIKELRPAQEKAINAGILDGKNVLVCTPTASGKTLIAELAAIKNITERNGKVIYIVPLIALANQKYKEFKEKYDSLFKTALSIGAYDNSDSYLINYDFLLCTSEKLDSLTRHHAPWIQEIKCVVIDEIHLLNDISRGPTLEILITTLRKILPSVQIIGLSATIGNPKELADWLKAELVIDKWRPVPLKKGIYLQGETEFVD